MSLLGLLVLFLCGAFWFSWFKLLDWVLDILFWNWGGKKKWERAQLAVFLMRKVQTDPYAEITHNAPSTPWTRSRKRWALVYAAMVLLGITILIY